MADAVVELEQILLSSKFKLTREERDVLDTCKGKALSDCATVASIAGGAVWSATSLQFLRRSLRFAWRINLTISAAVLSGGWSINRSLDSCLDHILSLDGSRMQKELANLMLTKYRDDPRRMKLINKHFYLEKVFDDLSIDTPISRWRLRNVFGDRSVQSWRTENVDTDSKSTDVEPEQSVMTSGADMIADPLDCVLGGYWGKGEEIHHPETTAVSPRRRIRANKRAHRRHRLQQQEDSSTSQYAQAQVE
ncbi:hypothetical protein NE237_016249 [Protea cynaroides]|uniref:Uncharacterized protein n=1 Tax=Protea cynaroides TaxID=273540 RepID=A0A9Q0KFD2_9MAGN|nr:hypothetical protein NE237_016249 [Protea cynaroides]